MDPPASAEQAAVCVTGRDAHAFLQGQLTQDLALLGPAVLLRAALNTPQGRVIARPWVFERDGVTTLIVPAELGAPLVARLKRFVLRAQVELRLAGPEELALAPLSEALAPTGGHQRLTHGLRSLPGLRPPIVETQCTHAYYVYPIALDVVRLGVSRARVQG